MSLSQAPNLYLTTRKKMFLIIRYITHYHQSKILNLPKTLTIESYNQIVPQLQNKIIPMDISKAKANQNWANLDKCFLKTLFKWTNFRANNQACRQMTRKHRYWITKDNKIKDCHFLDSRYHIVITHNLPTKTASFSIENKL